MPATKNQKQKRQYRQVVLLTASEKQRIEARAQQADLTISELLRHAVLYQRLPQRVTEVSEQTYRELGKIGCNINQLAQAAHNCAAIGITPPAATEELEKLRQTLMHIRSQIAKQRIVT